MRLIILCTRITLATANEPKSAPQRAKGPTGWGRKDLRSISRRRRQAAGKLFLLVTQHARRIGAECRGMGEILVGTSSWTDKSLIESGRFYPPNVTKPEERLRYYASQFPIVEIDSSYYGIPTVENARLWVEPTPPHFVFNVKAYRLFTRHQTPLPSLGEDIRAALGPREKANIYENEMPPDLVRELWRHFRAPLQVLRDAGKLGAVHFQFAPWVAFHPQSFDYIEHCRAMMAGFTLAVEFRNKTWFETQKHADRTLKFERENGLVNVVVDAPQGVQSTIPSVWEVTNPALAVVRLHGRNRETWNRKGLSASSQRFNYEYDDKELAVVATEVKALSEKAQRTHVLFNVNYQDQGQRAAKTLGGKLAH